MRGKYFRFLPVAALCMGIGQVFAHEDGLVTQPSAHSYQETQDKLQAALKEKGLILFAEVDHTKGAEGVGLKMLPEKVFIFGNPKGGTPFMVSQPKAAIDFPLKALVWQDEKGKVFVTYNSMEYVTHRHHIKDQEELAKKIDGALAAITKAATE